MDNGHFVNPSYIFWMLSHANEAPACSHWPEYVKIRWLAARAAHEGPLPGAGILQNADVAERPNVWPASRVLEARQMGSGQTQGLAGCWGSLLPSASVAIPALLKAGLWALVDGGINYKP